MSGEDPLTLVALKQLTRWEWDLKRWNYFGRCDGQVVRCAHPLLWRPEFESRYSLRFFWKIVFEKNENKQKEAVVIKRCNFSILIMPKFIERYQLGKSRILEHWSVVIFES